MKAQQLVQAGTRPAVQVRLPVFEGPFDLLIYLVERNKLDIYDIAVADITSSYIESLQHMEFDPETASDFIYMAAYLLELKSRSLLPRTERIRPADEPDPRQELIMRLVETSGLRSWRKSWRPWPEARGPIPAGRRWTPVQEVPGNWRPCLWTTCFRPLCAPWPNIGWKYGNCRSRQCR